MKGGSHFCKSVLAVTLSKDGLIVMTLVTLISFTLHLLICLLLSTYSPPLLVSELIQLLEYVIPTTAATPPKSPRLTHYPTANKLSNYRRVGHTEEVKWPEGPPTRSLGLSGPRLLAGGPSGLLTSSFAPFGRSGRMTHASVIGQCVSRWIVC